MITLESLQWFFGWCLVLNFAMMMFSMFFILVFNNFAINIHQKLFDIDKREIKLIYFKYLAQYKLLVIIFNLIPYLVLRFC